jgi:hypothetical protein
MLSGALPGVPLAVVVEDGQKSDGMGLGLSDNVVSNGWSASVAVAAAAIF